MPSPTQDPTMDIAVGYNARTGGVEFRIMADSVMAGFVLSLEDAATLSSKLAGIVLDERAADD